MRPWWFGEYLWWLLPQRWLTSISLWTCSDVDAILLVHLHGSTKHEIPSLPSIHLLIWELAITSIDTSVLVCIEIVLIQEISLVLSLIRFYHIFKAWKWASVSSLDSGNWSLGSCKRCCFAATCSRSSFIWLFNWLFHLGEGSLSKVFLWLNTIEEFSLAKPCICIKIKSSNDCNKKRITCIDATLYQESLQIGGIYKLEIAVINVWVQWI